MKSNEITNNQRVIDSRDIIARIEELEDQIVELEAKEAPQDEEYHDLEAELASLKKVQKQAESSPDWQHGEALIHNGYFTDYIKDLISDCYELPKELTSGDWPYRHITIDYEAAAEEAKQDYIDVDFDGVTYWIRA